MGERETITVLATIEVTYDVTDSAATKEELVAGLRTSIFHQVGNGLLTSHTDCPVETYDVS